MLTSGFVSRTSQPPKGQDAILITATGVDRPGITAELAHVLAESDATVLDVEQVVVQGQLSLTFLVSLDEGEAAARPVLKEILWKARELELHVDFDVAARISEPVRKHTWALMLLGDPVDAPLISEVARTAEREGFNIERIERLSARDMTSLELTLSGQPGDSERRLRAGLLELRERFNCDLALQAESLTRRSKRLVVMDMDSTLIQQEVIDELAASLGVTDKVAAITERAMNGELDFDQSLRERVRLLEGTPVAAFEEVLQRIELTPGAEQLVRVLKRLGYRLAVISGGFIEVVEPIRQKLGLDYAFANRLEIQDGRLTGAVSGPIVNRERKAELLETLAQAERIALDQVIAIGDGANDLDMLQRAGLGIAFNAKRVVQQQASYAINSRNLTAILYLLGIRDVEALAIDDLS